MIWDKAVPKNVYSSRELASPVAASAASSARLRLAAIEARILAHEDFFPAAGAHPDSRQGVRPRG
eukprot:2672486-Heterocapsa_arctica.AAC.1